MNRRLKNLSVYGPVIALLLIGATAYIITVKLTTPKITTLSAQPEPTISQSTTSAVVPNNETIQTKVSIPTTSQLQQWQQAATNGTEGWRLDPLATAQHMSLDYGFASSDSFSLAQASSSSATTVQVTHGTTAYILTMYQPSQTGANGIWIIQSIAAKK